MVLNKTDLVSEEQQSDILDRISLLNPKARYLYGVRKILKILEPPLTVLICV